MIVRKGHSLNRPGTATQQKGLSRLLSILDAARDIFTQQGYNSLTMRKVAGRADISIGNLNYYYRTKEDLLRDLLEYVINPYLEEFDRVQAEAGDSPQEKIRAVLDFWISDLGTAETTGFFPECWALANHNPFVAELVNDLYIKARQALNELIPQINPSLTQNESEEIALLMCASMEGLTVFAGYQKPWADKLPALKQKSIEHFMHIIENTKGSKSARRKPHDE